MNYPLFERTEGFYRTLALAPSWENRLVRRLDVEELLRSTLDEAELTILHFNQLGYTIREIAWYYGVNEQKTRRRLKSIFHRLAVRSHERDSRAAAHDALIKKREER